MSASSPYADRARLRELLGKPDAVKVLTDLFSIGSESQFGRYAGAEQGKDGKPAMSGPDAKMDDFDPAPDAARKKAIEADDPFVLVMQCPAAWHEADSQAVALALAKGRLQHSDQTPLVIKHETRRAEDGSDQEVYNVCLPPGVQLAEMQEDQRRGAVEMLVDLLARKQAEGAPFELNMTCPALTTKEDCDRNTECAWSFDTCVAQSLASQVTAMAKK